MRLFTAIELTDEARAAIGGEQVQLRAALPRTSLRMVRPEQMHLTLSFIGEVDAPQADTIIAAMREPVAVVPFTIQFGGVGMFPPRGAPRVLWLGVVHGGEAAIELQHLLAERLRDVGVAPEKRPYHPHLTLGRWRDSRPSDRIPSSRLKRSIVARVDVASATLFQSRLSPNGSAYTVLAQAPLIGEP